MTPEIKNCQNCKNNFIIESEDFSFYQKMEVPAPTFCPECRMIRRFSFTNTWNLYKRKCAKCNESTLSMFSEDKPHIVYCMHCWWADDWDGTEYAMDYDPNRNFLEQVRELILKTPWQTLTNMYTMHVNSPYVNATGPIKNGYMTFWADYCENIFYSSYINGLKDSADCFRMKDSELCYESVGLNKCYRTFFSEECDSCTDTWFSRSCSGLVDCFGCVNLRNKSHCIFNEQYTRESYFEKLKEFNLESSRSLEVIRQEVFVFWNKYPRRLYIGNALNKNVTGDYIYESKNAKDCYMCSGVEDSRFVQFISVPKAKDTYDYTGWGDNAERIYESSVAGFGTSNIKFSNECWPNAMNIEYSIFVNAGKNCFGCINLKKKEYCILNKKYSKEEYEKLKKKIIEDMKNNPYVDTNGRTYKYGEFFPVEFSPFCYNESNAQKFFEKTKEEVIASGFKWFDEKNNNHITTIISEKIPDKIDITDESILNEIIECSSCNKAYKFTLGELGLMKRLNIPLPKKCFNCREKIRFSRINLPRLFERKCTQCDQVIKTSYSPERQEIIYCEKCYQDDIY